jgi:hypothetical protein
MGLSGQFHAPVALLSGKEALAPTRQEAGWAPEPALGPHFQIVNRHFDR